MAKGLVKPGDRKSLLAGQSELTHAPIPTDVISFSFAHLDQSQGQTLVQWEKDGLLEKMLTRFKDHGTKPLTQCYSPKFKSYQCFPPKTNFKHPKWITNDAKWACMHLNGKVCVGGHIVRSIFFVVFLDCDHEFWLTELKHT